MAPPAWTIDPVCPSSTHWVSQLPPASTVADIGCFGWLLGDATLASGATLIGVDQAEPPGRPAHAKFAHGSGPVIDIPDDACDLVVAGHVLEHVLDGVAFAAELLRIVKPGGLLWIETPSELGCQSVSSDNPQDHRFLSFWDDPTHIRPWTPAALYRLAISCQAIPLAMQRGQTGDVPVATMLARKPASVKGKPATRYVTLKHVAPGLQAAYETVWGRQ
jgi:SAM-dependent methyltransferase